MCLIPSNGLTTAFVHATASVHASVSFLGDLVTLENDFGTGVVEVELLVKLGGFAFDWAEGEEALVVLDFLLFV